MLQSRNSEKFEFDGIGFGGIEINPCKFDYVFSKKPDIMIFDWAVKTGGKYTEKYIKASIYRSIQENAIPVYVIFPQINRNTKKILNFEMINLIRNLSIELKFTIIDLSVAFNGTQLLHLLRDTCHTNDIGGQFYADFILEFLSKNELKKPAQPIDVDINAVHPNILPLDRTVLKFFEIFLKGELFAIFHIKGRYSNYIDIFKNGNFFPEKKELLFDVWCHYERLAIYQPEVGEVITSLKINVLNESFTRKCEKQLDWNLFSPKLEIKEICFSGELEKIIIDDKETKYFLHKMQPTKCQLGQT